jgi:hypothetical protein
MKKILLLTFLFSLSVSSTFVAQQQSEQYVLVCTGKYSKKYHSYNCKGLKKCKGETKKITLSEAKKDGKTQCGYCYK